MTIAEVYKEYIDEKGWTEDEAAGLCLGIMTSGLIDASDTETYARLKQEFIDKQKEDDDDDYEVWRAESVDRNLDGCM